jgi:formylglycine-generating enzyme required for sulfatase activity
MFIADSGECFMPTSRPHIPAVVRTCVLLSALIFSLAACKSGRSGLPETTNRIGITMVAIPAGSFTMGEASASDQTGQKNSAFPAHTVTVKAFQIAKTEVTVGQYRKFLAALGREGLRQQQDTDFLKFNSFGDDAPVVQLSPKNVREFIEWLNSVDGGGYRLPTEAEWEYACHAGGNDTYCGGNDIDSLGWHAGNSGRKTHSVAQKKPNAFGLYDMSGNAEEWVEDCWHYNYNDAPTDGSAWEPDDGKCKFLVVRGGYWSALAGASRATRRDYKSTWPHFYHPDTGIRLARTR